MPALPNLRHERFAKNMALGMSQAEAYRKAGYKSGTPRSAWTGGSLLVRNQKVSGRIYELLSKSETKLVVDRNTMTEVFTDLLHSARTAGNYNAAKGAADSLAKLHGLMIDRKETGRPGDFSAMADDQLREFIQTAANQLGSDGGGEAGTEEEGEEEEG